MEDETYSLIFTSLKHPIRRRILRMLADNPLMFSEIQETLRIDSGHLNYHLVNLGELIYNIKNGHYCLSSFGRAAVKLMGGVEEHASVSSQRRNKQRRLFAKTFSIVLALVLVCASVYFVSYVTAVPSDFETTKLTFEARNPSSIDVGETIYLNFTLKEFSGIIYHRTPVPSDNEPMRFMYTEGKKQSISVMVDSKRFASLGSPRDSTFTGWYENSMWLEVETNFNHTFLVRHMTGTNITGVNDNQVATTVYSSLFSHLSVDIHTPDGIVINDCFPRRSDHPYVVYELYILNPCWFIETSEPYVVRSSEVPLNQIGSYKLKIANDGAVPLDRKFSLTFKSQRMERPYFYWGIAGLVAALGYLIFAATGRIRRDKSDKRLE